MLLYVNGCSITHGYGVEYNSSLETDTWSVELDPDYNNSDLEEKEIEDAFASL